MNIRHTTYIGIVVFATLALFPATQARSLQVPSSPAPVATSSIPPDTQQVPVLASAGTGAPEGDEMRELLKSYERLWWSPDPWKSPDPAPLRAAEQGMLKQLQGLPPHELVALLRDGLSTRSVNLVLIALENAMRGTRRNEYEDALVLGMEDVFEQPEKLEVLSDVTLGFNPSRENAEVAARLLMKRRPVGKQAEHLGGFASRLEGEPRRDVKEFAVTHNLIETLGWLVDDSTDVVRLQGYLANSATRDRAQRALQMASQVVTSEQLRLQIRLALDR